MRNMRSYQPVSLCNFALVACFVALLGVIPGCDFIEDLLGGGGDEQADAATATEAGADNTVPQPPPTEIPDAAAVAAALTKDGGAAAAQLPDAAAAALPPGFDPSKLPPGFDPSKLPPGFDPSKLPPGFDPSKLPPGVDPADLASGKVPPTAAPDGGAGGSKATDITADLPGGTKLPENLEPAALPPAAAMLPADVQAQLAKALAVRKSLDAQIRRLNYVIDRNLTKNPADVVRLNRYVRAKRELDHRLNAMRKQYGIPAEALQSQ